MLRFSKRAFAPFSATIGTSGDRNSNVPGRHVAGLRRHGLLTSDDPAKAGQGGIWCIPSHRPASLVIGRRGPARLPDYEGGLVPNVNVSIRDVSGQAVVVLRGELDLAATPGAASHLIAAVAACGPFVIVDLAALESLGYGGLGVLVRVLKWTRDGDGEMSLAAPQQQVHRVLDVTGLIGVFPVFASVEQAVSSARRALPRPPAALQPSRAATATRPGGRWAAHCAALRPSARCGPRHRPCARRPLRRAGRRGRPARPAARQHGECPAPGRAGRRTWGVTPAVNGVGGRGRPEQLGLAGRAGANYAATVPVTRYETMGWLRTAVGIALIAAPGAPMRLSGQREPSGADLLLMRTIGS